MVTNCLLDHGESGIISTNEVNIENTRPNNTTGWNSNGKMNYRKLLTKTSVTILRHGFHIYYRQLMV